eukprot:502736_1
MLGWKALQYLLLNVFADARKINTQRAIENKLSVQTTFDCDRKIKKRVTKIAVEHNVQHKHKDDVNHSVKGAKTVWKKAKKIVKQLEDTEFVMNKKLNVKDNKTSKENDKKEVAIETDGSE